MLSKVHRGQDNISFPKVQTNNINVPCVEFIIVYVVGCAGLALSVYRLATGWRVRGSIPGEGRDFTHLSRPALRPTQPPIQWVPVLSRGKKRSVRDADPSHTSSAVVKKE